ncbi:hypothetical protein DSECCO2_197820 [anaerobic digester metagenome]
MIDFIIQKAGGETINLYSKNASALSTVTNAEQSSALNSDDIVRVAVDSAVKIAFDIGDKMNILGRWYKINRLPTVKKTGNRLFTYNIELEGVQYDLARVVYDLTIDTTSNALQDVQADMLTGNLQRFATVLIANANRVFPGKWVLGDFPAGTEDKTLVFGETDNCLLVLQRLCSEYNTEFEIIQAGDANTLHFRKAGQIYPYTFEYGKGKGLYSLERLNVSTSNIVTRLKVYGGTRNITAKYRAARLCLPGKTKGQSYIQKTGPANNYGIWEATKIFEHIYPKRTGTVTAIDSGNVLKLTDSTMNFDLNEKEADGITTKYLIEGSPAKIHFNTGNLSGYEFEIQSYDHATKTFTLKPFEDERGERFPSEKSSAFKFAVNDKYVLLDIALPQSYIDNAEEQLAEEGDIYYDQNSQPKVQYSLEVAEDFLKELSGAGSITNIFSVGDYIPVKDADIDVDKSVRVQSFTRDLLNPFSYKLNISDTVTTSITNRVISELIEIDKITKINDIKSQVKARRDWRSAQELLDMVFDTEGDYYSEKIKPNSIETSMLAVGAKSTQFGLVGTVIQANYNGNKNSVNVKGGTLSHYAIEESGRNWTLADGTTTLTGDSTPYYIYAKCQKVGTAGSIIFSTSKITVDEDPSFYHFLIGVVNSVDPTLNVRSVALTYGFTTVNGKFIRTGRIQSNDGLTYFDLDLGEIGGKITFRSTGGTDEDLAEILDGVSSDIQEAQATADGKSTTFLIQPTSYKLGDMWVLNADQTVNGIVYKQGDILTATQDSATYNQAHWVKKVRYTDDTAIDELEIGSRNFWLNSEKIDDIHRVLSFSSRDLTGLIEDGAEMTIQFDIDVPVGYDFRIYKSNTSTVLWGTSSLTQVFAKVLTAGKQTIKTTFNFDSTKPYIILYKNDSVYRRADVSYLMLGLGNKVTWSEAPEDVQARINTAKQEALSAASDAQSTADSLKDFTDTAFRDGIIDRSESIAIEKYKNSLNEAMSKAEASYNKVYTNTYLEGTAKTSLLNAKVNLWGQRDTLLSAINTAISGGITTPAQKTAVDNAFSTFNNLMTAFQNALEEANKAIQAKLDALSTEKVDNLQIGGRNLFNKSKLVVGYPQGAPVIPSIPINSDYGFQITGTAGTTNTRIRIPDVISETGWWTVSCEVQGNFGNLPFSINIAGMPKKSFTTGLATEWKRVEITSNVSGAENYVEFADIGYIVFKVRRLKIEKANKATDWTEAPEDSQAAIEQAQLAADGYMRARYIRDWTKGNTSNNLNQWSEIKIFNKAGVNIALGKIPETNGVWSPTRPASNVTDNNIDSNGATNETTPIVEHYAKIDLGQIYYDIDYIQVWHPYTDGRTYYGTKTEISTDGVNWTPVFDSAKSGTYKETAAGNIISFRPNEVLAKVLRSAATTDKFSGFDGGLATAVIMEMREPSTTTRGDATAGISGIQGAQKTLPAFWAGGTYAQAVAGTAKSIDKHDGSGHRAGGKLSWDAAGNLTVEGTVNAIDGEFTGIVKGNAGYFEGLVRNPFVETTNQTTWWGDESGFHPIITNPATASTNIIARNLPGAGRTSVKLPTEVINGYRISVFNGETADNGGINSWGKIEISAGTKQILNANYGFTTDIVDQYNDQPGTISVLTGRSNPISANSMIIDFGEYVELVGVGNIGWIVTNRLKAR